jgi:hypothetical protein
MNRGLESDRTSLERVLFDCLGASRLEPADIAIPEKPEHIFTDRRRRGEGKDEGSSQTIRDYRYNSSMASQSRGVSKNPAKTVSMDPVIISAGQMLLGGEGGPRFVD